MLGSGVNPEEISISSASGIGTHSPPMYILRGDSARVGFWDTCPAKKLLRFHWTSVTGGMATKKGNKDLLPWCGHRAASGQLVFAEAIHSV